MDYVWSPWRYRYVSQTGPGDECIFCKAAASERDEENYILHRAERNFLILNRFPYTNGHLMIAPYEHVPALEQADEATLAEMMSLARRAEVCLREVYRPQGLNLGMNLGRVRRRRGGRPYPHARAAPLDRRRQLHDRHRRDPRAAGRPLDHLPEAAPGLAVSQRQPAIMVFSSLLAARESEYVS